EVVVVPDVPARAEEAVAPVEARPQLEQPAHAGVPRARGVGVPEQELEEPDEVVGVPLARRVRLAEADLAAGRQPAEEGAVVDLEAHAGPAAEAARGAVGEHDLEGAALEPGERALEDRGGDSLQQAAAGVRLDTESAHGRADPSPGVNAGLWWNGTRFSQRRSACQWMSAVTWRGISGYRTSVRSSARFVSSRRRPW